MADPVSLVASCLGIACGITKLMESINSFVSDVREARRDMSDVQKELEVVRAILLDLRDKGQDLGFDQVHSLKIHVFEVVSNCGNVVTEMKKLLRTMRNGSMRWATSGKRQMVKLKLNLEAHKSTLSIALAFVTG
jgi:Fungal N-terminal domain of STAND proteins